MSGGGLVDTPMMQQYRELKQRYPDHLLLFRLGDFYELFLEDAKLGARLLSITLTSRQGAPMAGIPHHSADGYIARLVQAGQKIAICEQLSEPGPVGLLAGDRQRQQDVLLGAQHRQQVEELKDETNVVAAKHGQLRVVESGDLGAGDRD